VGNTVPRFATHRARVNPWSCIPGGLCLQQATLAIRAGAPLDVLSDIIQPFPTFSEIYLPAVKALRSEIAEPVATG
jgi:hypothetical protein